MVGRVEPLMHCQSASAKIWKAALGRQGLRRRWGLLGHTGSTVCYMGAATRY